MRKLFLNLSLCLLGLFLSSQVVSAVPREYFCEVGLQLGGGYYVGDANPQILMNPLEVLGAQFRYKIDKRWAIQLKAQYQRIEFRYEVPEGKMMHHNPMMHLDATAEFNFFRFGYSAHDHRVKKFTPYIFAGIGCSAFNAEATMRDGSGSMSNEMTAFNMGELKTSPYIPVGIGFKWKFAERWQLHAAWQHQVYLGANADAIEGIPGLNDAGGLNGINIMNNDVISTATIGILFEFAREKKLIVFCD